MSATVWIIILVPLVLFGWLIGQAMPTPRERQLQRLRARARALDLAVSVRRIEDPDPESADRVSSAGRARDPRLDVAAYGRGIRLPTGVEKRHVPGWQAVWMRHHADRVFTPGMAPGWRLERADLPLLDPVIERLSALLRRAPRGTLSIEAGAGGCTLCWRERGGDAEVEQVAELLDDLRDFQLELALERSRREVRAQDPDVP
ncbi:MAG: hypothetical protein U5R48_05720 [Gammaproteobacteria bacterium]|nr:hypothetical protein [Gammaproteobacteria bacterium]